MAFDGCSRIWMNGDLVPVADAKIHVLSHVMHYGSAVFEGMRAYENPQYRSAIFRLDEHVDRLFNSAKILRMEIPFSREEIKQACLGTLRDNDLADAYVRPLVYRGLGTLGVDPTHCPVDTLIATWRWGAYLGEGALEQGVDVRVSSWTRIAPNTLPTMAKSSANYVNSQLIRMEANQDGYIEGIALDASGYVCEGSGENIFVLYQGRLLTPPLGNSILEGITRDSVMTLAKEAGHTVVETMIPREMLYIADEVFFTGSAAEITPIRSVDRVSIGSGKAGEVALDLQRRFFEIINGEVPDRHGWLTPVYPETAAPVSSGAEAARSVV